MRNSIAVKRTPKVNISVMVEKEVVAYLDALAQKEGLSRSLLVNNILTRAVKNGETEEVQLFRQLVPSANR